MKKECQISIYNYIKKVIIKWKLLLDSSLRKRKLWQNKNSKVKLFLNYNLFFLKKVIIIY